MAQSQSPSISEVLVLFGIFAFLIGVFADILKPPSGTIIDEKRGALICRYPDDDSVQYAGMSIVALLLATAVAAISTLAAPDVLFRSAKLVVMFFIAVCATAFAGSMMMWAIVTEARYFIPETECATIKSGLFSGAAFLVLIAVLFWVICYQLVMKAKFAHHEDIFHGCALLA